MALIQGIALDFTVKACRKIISLLLISHVGCVQVKLLSLAAAVTPSARTESSDPALDAVASLGSVETGEEGNHLSERPAGNEGQEEGGSDGRVRPDPSTEPAMEFSCGLEVKEGELDGTLACGRGGGGASELHQYDGVPEEGEGQNGLDCFLSPKVPALSVMDRLTEIHGSEALSFGSALAAQVAARSHSLITMEEQTFGDDEEEDDEEQIDGLTADRD